jgi:uncharacterized protein
MNEQIKQIIKSVVSRFLPDSRVLLFGSHARGDFDRHSDYDLLIITQESYTFREKIDWASKINRALVLTLNVPFDVLLNSEEEMRRKKELPGHVVRWAVKEGIEL